MRGNRWIAVAAVLLAAAALALVLVSTGIPTGSPGQGASVGGEAYAPAGEPPRRWGRSPLAAYPGFGHDPEADEARFEREELARERRIAACMEQQGFPYTPAPAVRVLAPTDGEAPPETTPDPNRRFVETLDADRRRAYYLALYGIADPFSEAAEDLHDPRAGSGGGCSGEALRAIPGVYAAHSRLSEELAALRRAILGDERVRSAEQSWAACLAERGLDGYETPRDLRAHLDRTRGSARPPGPDAARKVAQEHRRTLEAGRACDARVGLTRTRDQVRMEREAAFVERHREVLDRHLESLRGQERLLQSP